MAISLDITLEEGTGTLRIERFDRERSIRTGAQLHLMLFQEITNKMKETYVGAALQEPGCVFLVCVYTVM